MKNILSALCLGALLAAGAAQAAGRVYFVEPQDGATVKSPFKVRFGLEGMAIAPAGDTKPDTGHHHLIIDGSATPQGEVVPTDDSHRHFGKGQTETELTLPPGEHTLTLQFANGAHQSYGEAMSSSIKVMVKP
ncbi:DUF4399 domain-containing protein [Pseudogulbenkiania sp. MAI-1]|uniref:DUF4399 domain-containing protein n=1 Tax=Pseudogulbenkiania sp. MAI-1 TaxID=990370 RepID=UPI00045EB615|nr:DUF4399 domain-containing protein [Pseudogulbenkiania sp. MAI-1]